MRTVISLAIGLLFVSVRTLSAQQTTPVETGSQVRVTAPDLAMHRQVATLEAWRGDTLVLARPWTINCPLASVTRLDVSRGRESNTLKGLGIGVLAGAALGAALGLILYEENGGEQAPASRGESTAAGAVFLGGLGGLIGLGIGAFTKSDRWEEVPLDQFRVSTRPSPDGRFALGMSVAF